ncbi:MAG: sugar phosphate isomerase/epimerase [Planctomycetota bacterium]|jgi:sugar phosphate isomerase/epimerase|nr:sugar phosphate isomerase/epimerase [Planctomycetota bacterium]
MSFKMGFSSIKWQNPDLEKVLTQVREAGWEGWEIRPSLDWLGTPSRIRRICDQTDMPVACVTGSGISLDNDWAMKERNKRRIDFAAEVEAENFMFMGAGRPKHAPTPAEDITALAELADELADYASQYDLEVCYHIHNLTTVDSRAQWESLMSQMKRARLCIDVSHSAFWDYDPVESIKDFQDRLIYVHLQDWKLDRWVELDEGELVDVPACLKALEEIGYDRWVVTVPGDTQQSDQEKMVVNREYLRSVGW